LDPAAAEPADRTGARTAEQLAADKEYAESTKIIYEEAFGGLRFDIDGAAARKLLGAPKQKTEPDIEGATGSYYSYWTWPGVAMGMVANEATGPWRARTVEIKAPSQLATKAGIRIGSARKAVEAKYLGNKYAQGSPESLVVGSPYGGLVFEFENDVVTSMSIGIFAF
jgi:hypothetical protein